MTERLYMPYELAMGDDLSRKRFYSRAQAVLKERDEALAKLAAVEGQNPCAWMNDHCETTIDDKQVDYWKSCGYKISPLFAKPVPADKPEARITEQDAMSILLEWDAYRAERSASGVTPSHFKRWMDDHGRALLNKLNADREQVPAVVKAIELLKVSERLFSSLDHDLDRKLQAKECRRVIADLEIIAATSHSQQSAVYGYVISDGFTEQFVKTLSDDDRKAAKRFNWDVIPLCRCPSHESEQGGDQ